MRNDDCSEPYSDLQPAGRVVSLRRFRNGRSLSPIRQAEAYWSALREGQGIPRRAQIDPRGLENLLPFAFVLERIAPGIARFRLAGRHLTGMAGMEVRGMPVSALFSPVSRGNVAAALENVFDAPAIVEMTLVSEPRYGRRRCEAQMILLPLKCDLGETSRALGVLVSDGTEACSPARLEVTGISVRDVSGLNYGPVADEIDPGLPATTPGGFADPAAPFPPRAPHLRLIKS